MLKELLRERARREAVQKAVLVNGLPVVQKGKGLPPGTIRTWKGERWRKVEQGKWEKVKGEKPKESSYIVSATIEGASKPLRVWPTFSNREEAEKFAERQRVLGKDKGWAGEIRVSEKPVGEKPKGEGKK